MLAISCYQARTAVTEICKQTKERTRWQMAALEEVHQITGICKDPSVKCEFLKLEDLIRYSDSVSHESQKEEEQKILEMIRAAKADILQKKELDFFELSEKLILMVQERNSRCSLLK